MVFMHECAVTEIDGNKVGAHTSIARIPFAKDYNFGWFLIRWNENTITSTFFVCNSIVCVAPVRMVVYVCAHIMCVGEKLTERILNYA